MIPSTVHEDHPDEIAIAAYREGRLPGAPRERIEAHLAICRECRGAFVLLAGLDGHDAHASRHRSWARWAAVAAALLLGALIVVPLREIVPSGSAGAPVFRGAAGGDLRPVAPRPGAVVSRDDLVFRWTPVEEAEGYRLRVWGADPSFLLEFEARDGSTEARWPADEPAAPAGELIWKVQALSHNRTLRESRPVSFEVRN